MAIGPINYSIGTPDAFGSVMRGFGAGRQLRGIEDGRAQQEALKLKEEAKQDDIATAFDSGMTAESMSELIAKYPDDHEAFKESWGILSPEKQQARTSQLIDINAAMRTGKKTGNYEVVKNILQNSSVAAENSGDKKQAEAMRTMIKAIDIDPDSVLWGFGSKLALVAPEKFATIHKALSAVEIEQGLAPSVKREAEAKATTAEAESGVAGRVAEAGAKKLEGEAVSATVKGSLAERVINNDINVKRRGVAVKEIEARIKKEKNAIAKEKLLVEKDDRVAKKAKAEREVTAKLDAYNSNIDNSLATIDSILQNPELEDVTGTIQGAKYWPTTFVGTVMYGQSGDDRADAIAGLETVRSQQFLDNLIMVKNAGAVFGSLDKAEGSKIEGYIANLKTSQSDAKVVENLEGIQTVLSASRDREADRVDRPRTIPNTPKIKSKEGELDSAYEKLLQEYPEFISGGD